MALYHADIRLPSWYRHPAQRVTLKWTNHANKARHTDRYANAIPEFHDLPLSAFKTIEIETCENYVTKYVVRGHWTKTLDLVFVLIPNGNRPWTVKTVWINERNDVHNTLDRSKYVR